MDIFIWVCYGVRRGIKGKMTVKQKIVFLQCVDFSSEDVKKLLKVLQPHHEDYLFIATNKQIEAVDREELLKVIRG